MECVIGTPALVTKGTDDAVLAFDDTRPRKRNAPGDQSMRKTIQDLVSSVDPNVKIEPEVEDVCLFPFLNENGALMGGFKVAAKHSR